MSSFRPSPTILLDTQTSQEISLEAEFVVRAIDPDFRRMTFEEACALARGMTAAGSGLVGIYKLSAITEPSMTPATIEGSAG